LNRNLRLFWLLFGGFIIVDQLVKYWSRTAAQGTEGRTFVALWPNVFELKLVFNEGIAFGMAQGAGMWLAPIAVLMAGGAAWYTYKHRDDAVLTPVTMGLLASGAIGNLIDRVWMGKVTDMFWIRAIDFPVFNVADMCITAAGACLLWAGIKDAIHKPDPAAKTDSLEGGHAPSLTEVQVEAPANPEL
jgi:signal peptidase II